MPKRRGRRSRGQEKIAKERIEKLLGLAMHSSHKKDYEQSKRFVELALLISKRYNQRLTRIQRRQICRKCNSFLDSQTSRNRLSKKGWTTVTCLDCGSVYRYVIDNGD